MDIIKFYTFIWIICLGTALVTSQDVNPTVSSNTTNNTANIEASTNFTGLNINNTNNNEPIVDLQTHNLTVNDFTDQYNITRNQSEIEIILDKHRDEIEKNLTQMNLTNITEDIYDGSGDENFLDDNKSSNILNTSREELQNEEGSGESDDIIPSEMSSSIKNQGENEQEDGSGVPESENVSRDESEPIDKSQEENNSREEIESENNSADEIEPEEEEKESGSLEETKSQDKDSDENNNNDTGNKNQDTPTDNESTDEEISEIENIIQQQNLYNDQDNSYKQESFSTMSMTAVVIVIGTISGVIVISVLSAYIFYIRPRRYQELDEENAFPSLHYENPTYDIDSASGSNDIEQVTFEMPTSRLEIGTSEEDIK